jgi:anti-sigma factor RsiW
MTLHANDDDASAPMLADAQRLTAYVAGALDAEGRRQVEGYLACNPDLAARVMGELHRHGNVASAPSTARRRTYVRTAVALGCALLVTTCLLVAGHFRRDLPFAVPDFVEDAVVSHQTTLLRVDMASQEETPAFNPEEMRAKAKLEIPALPSGWRVMDVQLYPSDDGPSVHVLIQTPQNDRLTLFAVRARTSASAKPEIARSDGSDVIYWERGPFGYALLGARSLDILKRDAALLVGAPT